MKIQLTGMYILALIGSILLGGCTSPLQASEEQEKPGLPLLHFQKTRCYGECPAYEATVHHNGHVTFTGKAHVPVLDTLSFTLTPKELTALKQSILHLEYPTLQDLYPISWTDQPATLLTFYEKGKEVKRIKHFAGGPEKLLSFQKMVHQLIWKHLAAAKK